MGLIGKFKRWLGIDTEFDERLFCLVGYTIMSIIAMGVYKETGNSFVLWYFFAYFIIMFIDFMLWNIRRL